jgi:hypothetical protein
LLKRRNSLIILEWLLKEELWQKPKHIRSEILSAILNCWGTTNFIYKLLLVNLMELLLRFG